MRLRPASSAADWKLANDRSTPGSASELVTNGSPPNNRVRTVAAAPLKVLWPEMYSGNGGVAISGSQLGSAAVAGLPSVSASGIAVTGRQNPLPPTKKYFASQATMAASASAMFNSANS